MLAPLLAASAAQAGVKEGVDAWQAKNYTKAIQEWRGPAAAGDSDAQFNLAQAYKLGRGVPADLQIAKSWYEKAALQGHEQAQANLGLILFQGGDRTGAMPWIRKAADQGEPRAQYVLGTALFNGDLAAKDWPRAYALMTRAAAAGLPQAQASLKQMEQYIPLGDRQQGMLIAQDLERQSQSSSSNVVASTVSSPPPPVSIPRAPIRPVKPALPPKPVVVASNIAAPPPARIPASPPAPAPQGTPGGKWRVQLSATSSAATARNLWARLSRKPGFEGLQPFVIDMGKFTRLQAGPLGSRTAANEVCNSAKRIGQACFPVAP
jgi:TPR repeat protein